MAEQSEKSQREIRQSKECCKLRSLPHLVGDEHAFGFIHMWFVFLLRAEIYKNVPHSVPECPVDCSSIGILRKLYYSMNKHVFQKIAYCILTGITIIEDDVDIVKYFKQLLPSKFILPVGGISCKIFKTNSWEVIFERTLPTKLPNLYYSIEKILGTESISESTVQYQIMSLIMKWFNIACVLSWTPNKCDSLYNILGVLKCDMPLLSYWIPQSNACVELSTTEDLLGKCLKETNF